MDGETRGGMGPLLRALAATILRATRDPGSVVIGSRRGLSTLRHHGACIARRRHMLALTLQEPARALTAWRSRRGRGPDSLAAAAAVPEQGWAWPGGAVPGRTWDEAGQRCTACGFPGAQPMGMPNGSGLRIPGGPTACFARFRRAVTSVEGRGLRQRR